MKKLNKIFLLVIFLYCYFNVNRAKKSEEEENARLFIESLNRQCEHDQNRLALAQWQYQSNLTDFNLKNQLDVASDVAKNDKMAWQQVVRYSWQEFTRPELKRQFKKYSILGTSALDDSKLKRLNEIVNQMQEIYSTTKICQYNSSRDKKNCENWWTLTDLTDILATSRDKDLCQYIWLQWHDAIGPKCYKLYQEYVSLSNEAAILNNFTDTSQYWLHDYDDNIVSFRQTIDNLWLQLRPLYLQIYAYVRGNLIKFYGQNVTSERGLIPAHLLGNMWAQSWENVADLMLPYPSVKQFNLTAELLRKNFTVQRIFETAEEFFVSINLTKMPQTFWQKSILSKPTDQRDMVCHASAWDFYDDTDDVRIKQCAQVTEDHFMTAHHEMGHVEYFLQYKKQPIKFRDGANDGFHEAIGDLMTLSVNSIKHLKKIGLITVVDEHEHEHEREIELNNLFRMAMSKVTFLPFALLMDKWRWSVFDGSTKAENFNEKWWELRETIQGIKAPVNKRINDDSSFDPAAKYHIVADVPYLRYFISFILQFQFHLALCADGTTTSSALHECDIYGNKMAGEKLKNMLMLGSSKPWPDALEMLTGQRQMDVTGILEFFKPLQEWLEEKNRENGAFLGWEM